MRIHADEAEIIGGWFAEGGRLVADQIAKRIDDLVGDYLVEVTRSSDGWSVLYEDPHDHRYWELTYLDSASHGGGAPRLRAISADDASARYRI